MTDAEVLPVLPPTSNLAVLLPGDGQGMIFQSAPRWLTSALGVEHQFPLQPDARNPLQPLASLAEDLRRTRLPLRDYCMEVPQENGDQMILLAQGGAVDRLGDVVPGGPDGPGVVLSLRDVTEIVRQRRKTAAIGAFHGIIGQSLPMLDVYHRIATYGPTEASVIIVGETGTGKELVAKALHERSRRAKGAFVAVNCMALSVELFESELFGHEKGSFTGAYRQHRGRFQRADGGTLFLDEIGDMPLLTQAKMLRALEEGVVERVGSEQEERVDVRVVAATNVALEQAVQMRRFRADLYHRLSVLRIEVPPLRDRHGDIPLLVQGFLDVFNRRYEKNIKRLSPEALRLLEEYHWPGNVRELRNVMERLVIETQGEAIGSRALMRWLEERHYLRPGDWNADGYFSRREPIITAPAPFHPAASMDADAYAPAEPPRRGDVFWGAREQPRRAPFALTDDIVEASPLQVEPLRRNVPAEPPELTRETLQQAYDRARGNLTRAATALGVHKATLYRHMKALGLSREDLAAGAARREVRDE